MATINQIQLSQLQSLQNVSQETKVTGNKDGADFLSLLKDIQAKNMSNKSDNIATLQAPNFSGSVLKSPNIAPSITGTEAFLSNVQNIKKTNPIFNAIDTVNRAQVRADKSAAEFSAGYGDELQVVLDVSKAEKYLQFFSEVRVKFVNAIKELSRTQI